MNVLLGVLTMVFCLLLQAVLASLAIRYYSYYRNRLPNSSIATGLMVIVVVMILLLIGNFAQILLWALLFQWLGEFEQLSDAVYHSAVNFSTLGYGDIVMSEAHRILGPLEAVNGVLMIGVSTAVLMATFQDAVKERSA